MLNSSKLSTRYKFEIAYCDLKHIELGIWVSKSRARKKALRINNGK